MARTTKTVYRNPKVLAEAEHHRCQSCGADDDTVVAAHSNQLAHGKGKAIKAHDIPAYLCGACHHWLDQGDASRTLHQAMWLVAARKSYQLYEHLLDDDGRRVAAEMLGDHS